MVFSSAPGYSTLALLDEQAKEIPQSVRSRGLAFMAPIFDRAMVVWIECDAEARPRRSRRTNDHGGADTRRCHRAGKQRTDLPIPSTSLLRR
jgi:hypothetical protein